MHIGADEHPEFEEMTKARWFKGGNKVGRKFVDKCAASLQDPSREWSKLVLPGIIHDILDTG